ELADHARLLVAARTVAEVHLLAVVYEEPDVRIEPDEVHARALLLDPLDHRELALAIEALDLGIGDDRANDLLGRLPGQIDPVDLEARVLEHRGYEVSARDLALLRDRGGARVAPARALPLVDELGQALVDRRQGIGMHILARCHALCE